jgi:hypothetical protein
MTWKNLLLAFATFAFFAGCADPVPMGGMTNQNFAPSVDGNATMDFHAFSGANPAGGLPGVGGQLQCAQPENPVVGQCVPAYTNVTVTVLAPRAVDGTYEAHFVNATGSLLVVQLMEGPSMGAMATYTGAHNFTEDHTGRFTALELRLGNFVLASAPAQQGVQTVQDVAWTGRTLNATVSGLPANTTYQGNLYLANEDGSVQAEPTETFPVTNGPFSFTSTQRDIGAYAEFHIHVGHSKINLYKATIQTMAA